MEEPAGSNANPIFRPPGDGQAVSSWPRLATDASAIRRKLQQQVLPQDATAQEGVFPIPTHSSSSGAKPSSRRSIILRNVRSFDDHCSQDGMDRNAPNLNPRSNSTEISRIGGQTSRPPSKPPWRAVPPPAASSRDILPKGRPHKSSAQSALFSR